MTNTTRRIAALAAAALLAVTLGCASTAKQESTGQYVDDTVITTKVKAAILADPATKVLQVNVETYKGAVQLSGFVESQAVASRAVEVTRGVEGVTSVKNDMRLR